MKKASLFNLEKDDEFFLQREEIARTIYEKDNAFFFRADANQKTDARLEAEKILEIQKKFALRLWKVSKSKKLKFKDFLYLLRTFGWKRCVLLINYSIHFLLYNDLRLPEMDASRKSEYEYEVESYPDTMALSEVKTSKGISIIHTRK